MSIAILLENCVYGMLEHSLLVKMTSLSSLYSLYNEERDE